MTKKLCVFAGAVALGIVGLGAGTAHAAVIKIPITITHLEPLPDLTDINRISTQPEDVANGLVGVCVTLTVVPVDRTCINL